MASQKSKAGKINFQCQVGKTKNTGFLLALTGVDSNFCSVSPLPKEALIARFRVILLVIAKAEYCYSYPGSFLSGGHL